MLPSSSCMWLHAECLDDCVDVFVTTPTAVEHNLGAISQRGAQLLQQQHSSSSIRSAHHRKCVHVSRQRAGSASLHYCFSKAPLLLGAHNNQPVCPPPNTNFLSVLLLHILYPTCPTRAGPLTSR